MEAPCNSWLAAAALLVKFKISLPRAVNIGTNNAFINRTPSMPEAVQMGHSTKRKEKRIFCRVSLVFAH
jgi:hypothetical protein